MTTGHEGDSMRSAVLGLAATFGLAGCGSEGLIPIETAPVSGTATYDGKPLEDYRVFFYALGDAAQEPASGLVKPDGTFTLTVRDEGDGAIVGQNQIWV